MSAMILRPRGLVLAAAVAAAIAHAHAAGTAPIAVQERALVLPRLPAGADVPASLPADGDVKLPFVTGGAPGVAARINAAVWHDLLDGATAPTAPGPTWTPPADHLPQGTSSLAYKPRLLPEHAPRLLAIAFTGEGCGAYCETFAITRVFDLRDGRPVSLGDLVTVDGFAALARRVDEQRRHAYEGQVRDLRAESKAAPRGKAKDPDDDTADRLALNEECLKQVAGAPSTPDGLLADDLALDGRGGLVLTVGRCSNHAMRALDDVDEIAVAVPAAELRPLLTPYGLAVVQQSGDAAPPAGVFGRELHGRLGGLPITMRLEPVRDGADATGWYAYDKYRTPIALAVHRAGDGLRAVEQAASQGRLELSIAGGSLAGTWRDPADRKKLPVVVQ